QVPLVLQVEAAPGERGGDVLRDQPLSFAAEHRRHALRTVVSTTVTVPNPRATRAAAHLVPPHDPFRSLEEEGA
ncbi:type I-E CRISPR-associated protein Cas5/CasD, partial [Streptomyces sp. 8N706]